MSPAYLISWRYQKSPKNPLLRLIAWFSTLGIALGVAVLIVGLSAMNGFERELNQRILAVVPQVEISAYAKETLAPKNIQNPLALQQQLRQMPEVVAMAPFVRFQALIEHGNKMQVALIRGIEAQAQEKVSRLNHFVEGQGWKNFVAQEGVILGAGIAKKLQVKEGDWVTLLVMQKNAYGELSQPQRLRLPVSGILRLHGQLDYTYALMPLSKAQEFLNLSAEEVSGIELKVQDPFAVQQMQYSPLQSYPQALQANTWISRFGYMYNDIRLIRTVMYLAMALVIGVACFNIVSTLMMAVKDKQGDIAILRTLGANNSFIKKIFIYYGLIAGMKGTIMGMLLGIALALNLTTLIKGLENLLQHQFLSGGIYFIDFLPSKLQFQDVALVFICALVLSLLASIYPAWRASKLPPAKILMHK